LITVFDPNETFRGDAIKDALGLFAWGVGSGLAGPVLADLAPKLIARDAAPDTTP
jgi:hypothetical protein